VIRFQFVCQDVPIQEDNCVDRLILGGSADATILRQAGEVGFNISGEQFARVPPGAVNATEAEKVPDPALIAIDGRSGQTPDQRGVSDAMTSRAVGAGSPMAMAAPFNNRRLDR